MSILNVIFAAVGLTSLLGIAGEESPSPLLRGEWILVPPDERPLTSLKFEGRLMVLSVGGEEFARGLYRIAGLREDGGLKVLIAGVKYADPSDRDPVDPLDPHPGSIRFVIKDLGGGTCAVTLSNSPDWTPIAKVPDAIYERPKEKAAE